MHMEWMLEKIVPKKHEINQLRNEGCRIALGCFWNSVNSTLAGPILTEQQIMKLAQLELGIGFSIYPK